MRDTCFICGLNFLKLQCYKLVMMTNTNEHLCLKYLSYIALKNSQQTVAGKLLQRCIICCSTVEDSVSLGEVEDELQKYE